MLVTGIFWGTWFSLSRSIKKISPATFLENGQIFIKNLANPMRILLPLTLLFMILGVPFRKFGTAGSYLSISALLLILLTLIITVAIEVPIDNMIKRWTTATLPDNWKELQTKWQIFHTIRTFTSIASFLCLLLSSLFFR